MGKSLRLLTASVIASFAVIGLGTFIVIVLNPSGYQERVSIDRCSGWSPSYDSEQGEEV